MKKCVLILNLFLMYEAKAPSPQPGVTTSKATSPWGTALGIPSPSSSPNGSWCQPSWTPCNGLAERSRWRVPWTRRPSGRMWIRSGVRVGRVSRGGLGPLGEVSGRRFSVLADWTACSNKNSHRFVHQNVDAFATDGTLIQKVPIDFLRVQDLSRRSGSHVRSNRIRPCRGQGRTTRLPRFLQEQPR